MEQSENKFNFEPGFVLNVGITGHRNLLLTKYDSIEKNILTLLEHIKLVAGSIFIESEKYYSKNAPVLRMISSLAEGADRIAASAALKCGYILQCPLPFKKEEYELDFLSEQSKIEFNNLCGKADSIFEIGINADSKNRSYLNVGEIVLRHSDILITVWDGIEGSFIGGTSSIVSEALVQNIPVVWINSDRPDEIKIWSSDGASEDWKTILQNDLRKLFIPEEETGVFPELYKEKTTKFSLFASINQWFIKFILIVNRGFMGERVRETIPQPSIVECKSNFEDYFNVHFSPYYTRLDAMSIHYAKNFRTVGLLRQLLPFLATIGLAVGFYWGLVGKTGLMNTLGFFFQALFLGIIVFVSWINRVHNWHPKYSDYRLLAELIRQMVYLYPLGSMIRNLNTPFYKHYTKSYWINWYYTAVVRKLGLPNLKLDANNFLDCKNVLLKTIMGQINYHHKTAVKHNTVSIFLERKGLLLYNIGLSVTIIRVIVIFINGNYTLKLFNIEMPMVFNMLSLVIPALATAFFGILAQGNYNRLEQRSEAMVDILTSLKERLNNLTTLSFDSLKKIADETSKIMIAEVMDWNLLIKSKGISKI